MTVHTDDFTVRRRSAFAALSVATAAELDAGFLAIKPLPAVEDIRPAEIGMVMLRGRIGGTGQPFNVGEATVTRAAIRLQDGTTGFGYRLGRAPQLTRISAIIDALWQTPRWTAIIERDVLSPIRERLARDARAKAEVTAATRVEFFTLVRGED